MAVPAETFQTYQGVVNREDLSNVVYNISPTETPFMSAIGRGKASNTLHEWTRDELAVAENNAAVEGDNTARTAITPGERINNRTQISKKAPAISGTQQKASSAGNLYTMGAQVAKAMKEIKRDVEFALTQNTTAVTGDATTARQLRGLEGWIATNNNLAADGVAPDPQTNTPPTDGTARGFDEDQLKDVIQQCWDEGGSPDMIMVGGVNKQVFSGFNGGATQFANADDKRLVSTIDVYVSDFGSLKVVPNRFQRPRTAFVIDASMFSVDYLRPYMVNNLAKTGDSDAKQLVVEYTLRCGNEKASGAIRDLTT